jgi:hypothetical protein
MALTRRRIAKRPKVKGKRRKEKGWEAGRRGGWKARKVRKSEDQKLRR